MKTRSIDDLRQYALSLASLDQAEILKKLGIKHYDKNILKMAKPELLKNFGKSAKTLNKSLFIKNVIWQTFEKLQAGEPVDEEAAEQPPLIGGEHQPASGAAIQ